MNHRRDFLRENKLSLRDLQKVTIQRMTQQKQEHENQQYKHVQKFHKTQEQYIARRSASQTRNFEPTSKRHSRERTITGERGPADVGGGAGATIKKKPNHLSSRRACSQQRCSCCCNQQPQHTKRSDTQCSECLPRTASSLSAVSKAESCDKEVQTEDINDENFLQEALKKCSFSDVHQIQKQKSFDQLSARENHLQHPNTNYNIQQYEPELNTIHIRDREPYVHEDHYEDNKSHQNQMSQYSPRYNHTKEEMPNGVNQDIDQPFHNLNIVADMRKDNDQQLSARSRQTLCSTRSKRSIHKLGSREDICLPRYLEKEKREKEEERLRELNKDTNCPLNHHALSEEERLKALNNAQQKMASLINELNHMPMSMETLRIRNRKNEIEKELTRIELDIRLYSKAKVYIPNTSSQC